MAVGAAAAKGIKELTAELAKLQQMLLKAKNAKKDTKPIEQLIAKKRGEISKQKNAGPQKPQVERMSKKEQANVKKNMAKKARKDEARAYAKAATSPEAKKTSGSMESKVKPRKNKRNQYEQQRTKTRTSKKASEMYKQSPNTPESVNGKTAAKKVAAKKAPAKKRVAKKAASTQGVTVGKPRVKGPAANTRPSKTSLTPIGSRASSSKGSLTTPRSNAPTVSRRTASQSKAGNISTRVEKDMGRAERVNPVTGSMTKGSKSSTASASRRNANARKPATQAKKRGSNLKKAGAVAAGLGGVAYMMGRDDAGKKKSSAYTPKKSVTKPSTGKKVSTGTGGNPNRTNRTSVTAGATKPRPKTEKKKRESRYEKKWGELRWGDEGSVEQVQYRKRKKK